VFLGVTKLNVDAKGRIAIPARQRERLLSASAAGLVVTINPRDHCLWLYPDSEWAVIADRVARLPPLKQQNQKLQRLLLGHAQEVEPDGQGRILLAPELRDYARLEKRGALVGQGRRLELWNESDWNSGREAWIEEANLADSDLSQELEDLSL
jgi:MraZ protein